MRTRNWSSVFKQKRTELIKDLNMAWQYELCHNPADPDLPSVAADWLEENPNEIVPQAIRDGNFGVEYISEDYVHEYIDTLAMGRGNGEGYGMGEGLGSGAGGGDGEGCSTSTTYVTEYGGGYGGGNEYSSDIPLRHILRSNARLPMGIIQFDLSPS